MMMEMSNEDRCRGTRVSAATRLSFERNKDVIGASKTDDDEARFYRELKS